MKRILGKFLIIFALGCGAFTTSGCSGSNLVWCKSGLILTYNRHTGQLEVLWDSQSKQVEVVHDTVFVESDKAIIK